MPDQQGSVLRGALWMMGVIASFTAMGVAGRELSAELNTFQVLFWRSLVGLILISLILTRMGWSHARTARPVVQIVRNVIHFGGQFGWFYGLGLIPLAEVFAIEFTTPIWTLLFAAVLLSEKITPLKIMTVLLGFAGILVILRPGVSEVQLAQLSVLGAAAAYSLVHVITKGLVKTDSPLAIIFYMTVIQLPIGLVASLDGWVWPSPDLAPWIVLVGLGGMSAHYCLSKALSLADTTVVIPIDFLRLPVAMLVGWLLYREGVDIWVIVGAVMIFAGNYVNVRAETRRPPTTPPTTGRDTTP